MLKLHGQWQESRRVLLWASKEEFLRKATEIMLLSHFTSWSEEAGEQSTKQGTGAIPECHLLSRVQGGGKGGDDDDIGHLTWSLGK